MLQAEVLRKVQRLFGDSHQIFVTAQDVTDWINEARNTIARQTQYKLTSNTFTASVGTYTYNTATAIPAILSVTYGVENLPYMPVEELRSRNSDLTFEGTPEVYYTEGQVLKLWPKPLSTDTTTVTVQTNGIETNLTTSDTALGTPVQWHDDIVLFCTSRAHHRNQNYRASELAMGEFERNLAQRVHESYHPSDEFPVVRDDPHDYTNENSSY